MMYIFSTPGPRNTLYSDIRAARNPYLFLSERTAIRITMALTTDW